MPNHDLAADAETALRVALECLERRDAHVTEADRRKAAKMVNWILEQRGCQPWDPAVTDDKLTTLIDVIVFG